MFSRYFGRGWRNISKDLRINDAIKAKQIRVIGLEGEQIGILSVKDAISAALEKGLDLVEVAPQAKPPVCRIMDYGKYKYEQDKKARESRKSQNVITVKEIQIGLKIEEHDFNTKLRRARQFLKERDKVKLRIMFRGREITHQDLGLLLFQRFAEGIKDLGTVDREPKLEGRNMIAIFNPVPEKNVGGL